MTGPNYQLEQPIWSIIRALGTHFVSETVCWPLGRHFWPIVSINIAVLQLDPAGRVQFVGQANKMFACINL